MCVCVCVYVVVRCGVYFDLMLRERSPSQAAAAEAASGTRVFICTLTFMLCVVCVWDRSKRLRAVDREHKADDVRNRAQLIVCLMSPSPYRHNAYVCRRCMFMLWFILK